MSEAEYESQPWRPSLEQELLDMSNDLKNFKTRFGYGTDNSRLSQTEVDMLEVFSKTVASLEKIWATADKSTRKKIKEAEKELKNAGLLLQSASMGGWMRRRGYLNKERRALLAEWESKQGLPQYSESEPPNLGV